MWLICGIIAIIACLINLFFWIEKRETKILRFVSMSFTALTVAMMYFSESRRILTSDFAGLEDVMPTSAIIFIVLVILSIILNGITLIELRR